MSLPNEGEFRGIRYTIRTDSRRKRIAVSVTAGRKLVIKTPPRTSMKRIETLLDENEGWIRAQIGKHADDAPVLFDEGETLPLFGRECPVHRTEGESCWKGGEFYLHGESAETRAAETEKLYKALAVKVLTPMTKRIAEKAGVSVSGVRIGRAGKSWGYCKRSGEITYSFRLAAMNDRFAEYVVTHEVCHRIHFNHSPAFWSEVERLCPGGKALSRSAEVKAETGRIARICDKET